MILGSDQVSRLLQAVLASDGGRLLGWHLDQVDRVPGRVTTASYLVQVDWPGRGVTEELIGVTARAGGPNDPDRHARSYTHQGAEVVAWRYPHDPELPGLRTAAYPSAVAGLLNERQLVPASVTAAELDLTMITYRPRRRAVVRVSVPCFGSTFYLKVLRAERLNRLLARHRLLRDHRLPVAEILAVTPDSLVVMPALAGRQLSQALFDPVSPVSGHQVVDLLDALPPAVSQLPRRDPWTAHLGHYADLVATALPDELPRLEAMRRFIEPRLADVPPGDEPTHGDFYEQQVFVADRRITGLLDIDTLGPGRRADDLACLIAHVASVQGMNLEQANRLRALMGEWLPVFDHRVDPTELRLRAAAVTISLASGPFRGQEPGWQKTTRRILDAAEDWLQLIN